MTTKAAHIEGADETIEVVTCVPKEDRKSPPSPKLEPSGSEMGVLNGTRVDADKNRYPYCVVWTPIPFLTYVFKERNFH